MYGEDGFDGSKIEKQNMLSIGKSNKELYETHFLEQSEVSKLYIPEVAKDLKKNKKILEAEMKMYLENIVSDRDYYFKYIFKGENDNEIFAPVNFRRLIENGENNFKIMENLIYAILCNQKDKRSI